MLVRDIMQTNVVSATPETPISEVAKKMQSQDVGAVVVLDKGALAGIVTDRDLVVKHLAAGHTRECPVGEAMTAERPIAGLVTIRPDMDVLEAAQHFGKRKVGRLPVLEGDRVVGILSAGDMSRVLRRALDGLLLEGEKASDANMPMGQSTEQTEAFGEKTAPRASTTMTPPIR